MADRVERLANLLALLLETVEPVSLVQIVAELDGQYPDQDVARRQAFERDKAALREIGVPIETEIVTGGPYAGQTRYWIDRRAYELADLELEPDEMQALQLAVAAVHTGSGSGQAAIWKLGGALGDEQPPVSAMLPDQPELPLIRSAVASRSTIEFGYRGTARHLDPWGLLLRGGFWYVLGFDHDRQEQRTFRIDRFDRAPGPDRSSARAAVAVGPAGAFARPTRFDPRQAFPADPKQIGAGADEVIEALVHVDALRARAVVRELGEERVARRHVDESVEVLVPASNLGAFRSWLFGLLEHAVVLGPPDIREHVVDWLEAVALRGAGEIGETT